MIVAAWHFIGMLNVYLLTFCCYGGIIPGEIGTVDRRTNQFGSRRLAPSSHLQDYAAEQLKEEPYALSFEAREVTLGVIQDVCHVRHWLLLAAHVRTSHVHIVIEAKDKPEKVMLDIKVNASRQLNQREGQKARWSRHGSTRYLWTKSAIDRAVRYVVSSQGLPMQVYVLNREPCIN